MIRRGMIAAGGPHSKPRASGDDPHTMSTEITTMT